MIGAIMTMIGVGVGVATVTVVAATATALVEFRMSWYIHNRQASKRRRAGLSRGRTKAFAKVKVDIEK
jgi:hypothetical protein